MAAKSLLGHIKGIFQQQRQQPEGPQAQIHLEEILARCGQPMASSEIAQELKRLVQDCAAKPEQRQVLAAGWLKRYPLAAAIKLLGMLPEAEPALVLLWPQGELESDRGLLIDCLRHDAGNRALAAARVIPQLQDPLMVPLLLPALLDDTTYVAARVAEALAGSGAVAASAMAVLYQKEGCGCRPLLLEIFATMSPDLCPVDVIESALRDEDPVVRQEVARLLGRWGRKQDHTLLARLLEDESSQVRAAVAVALGQIGGSDCAKLLQRLDAGEDWQTQQVKAFALKRLGNGQTAQPKMGGASKKGRKSRKKMAAAPLPAMEEAE